MSLKGCLLLFAAIILIGTVLFWQSVGSLEGYLKSPRLGQEFAGTRLDALFVPVQVAMKGGESVVGVRIQYHGRAVWSLPPTQSSRIDAEAQILDPEVLREFNQKGVVQLEALAVAAKNQERMHIEFSGLAKESGTIFAEAEPVPFRVVRKGEMKVEARRQGSTIELSIFTNSRRVAVYSQAEPSWWPGTYDYKKVDQATVGGGRINYTVQRVGDHMMVVDGVGSVAKVEISPTVKVLNNYATDFPPAKTDEADYKLFRGEGVVGYDFDGGELLQTIVFWIACTLVISFLGRLRGGARDVG